MIAGKVVVDLGEEIDDAFDQARHDRNKLQVLDRCPDGVEVLVDIGRRGYVSQDAIHWLHQHDARLNITIMGAEPDAVQTLVRCARAGEWSVVA